MIEEQSISEWFEQRFGGKWELHSEADGVWECDDGNRYVQSVLTGVDMNGEYTGETSFCMYFRDGQTPRWV